MGGKFFTFVPDAVTHARKYFNKTNRCLMKQLSSSTHQYLLGKNFTAADIYYVHCLDWSQSIGWDDKWKNNNVVLEYLNLCRSRPAYVKVNAIKKEEQAAYERKTKKRSSKL